MRGLVTGARRIAERRAERAQALTPQHERCLEDLTGELQRTYALLGARSTDYRLRPSLFGPKGSCHGLEPGSER